MCDFYKKMNYLFFNLGKVFLFSSVIVFVMAIISLLIFLIFPHQIITSQDIDEAIIYLIYLAYKIWKYSHESLSMDMKLEQSKKGFFKAVLFGFITQISNPKTAIIIGSIFAALLPKELPVYSELLLCLIAFFIDAIWYCLVVVLLSTQKSQKIYLRFKKYIDRVAGTLLAALGIKLALDY